MKKIKKILAAVMTLAMVLGMSMTTMAATQTPVSDGSKGDIIVTGLQEGDTVKVYQVVNWDETTNNWTTSNWVTGGVDLGNSTESQRINWETVRGLVTDQTPIAPEADPVYTADVNGTVTISDMPEGAYLIVANGVGKEYSAMGAVTYMYNADTGAFEPANATLSAKGSTYTVTKTLVNGGDSFVMRGEEIEFDITSVFPSFNDEETLNRTFTMTDDPTGLRIKEVDVYIGEVIDTNKLTPGTDYTITTENGTNQLPAAADESVTVNFGQEFIDRGEKNAHAGEIVTMRVTATVTSATAVYSNEATTSKSSAPSTVPGATGTLVINKYEGDTTNKLPGAEFEVYKCADAEGNTPGAALEFVEVTPGNNDGQYKLAIAGESGSSTVKTGNDGTITIYGLDEGFYTIEETKAPDGYSTTDVEEVYEIAETTSPVITFDVRDSKLASLPETGGIGTTIFTVGGCIIMIAAAGLFFASRRKSSK